MPKQKRHVVYLSDDEWLAVVERAKANKVTASELIRDCLRRGHLRDVPWLAVSDKTWTYEPPEKLEWPPRTMTVESKKPMTQAERDAILRRVNKGG